MLPFSCFSEPEELVSPSRFPKHFGRKRHPFCQRSFLRLRYAITASPLLASLIPSKKSWMSHGASNAIFPPPFSDSCFLSNHATGRRATTRVHLWGNLGGKCTWMGQPEWRGQTPINATDDKHERSKGTQTPSSPDPDLQGRGGSCLAHDVGSSNTFGAN